MANLNSFRMVRHVDSLAISLWDAYYQLNLTYALRSVAQEDKSFILNKRFKRKYFLY